MKMMRIAVQSPSQLKKALLAECLRIQQEKADNARQAMQDVQESANEHQGSIEDKFESFREACHIQRELFGHQLEEAERGLVVLQRLRDAHVLAGVPGLGSVVETDAHTYFISVSIGEFKVDGKTYCAISAFSPLFLAMANHRVGDTFKFRGRSYHIKAVY
ncbi:hypothetical protein [Hymenobacter sp. DG25A]|uniref:hypothetical protein n=1 Tax=Hymenobacter sp. DG25A TaxID=1385663 RepID=UPI0006C85C02|nr:hypothetical protein [Hymenobacter sp. DG25A]